MKFSFDTIFKYWIPFFVLITENAISESWDGKFSSCLKSDLEREFSDISCTDEENYAVKEAQDLNAGTTCSLRCKSNNIIAYRICSDGRWQGDENACGIRVLSRPKRFFGLFVGLFVASLFVRVRRPPPPPPRDRTPPKLTCPPDMTRIADPLQVNTKVSWTEPTAWDARDGHVSTNRIGPRPGILLSENRINVIKYYARDKSGNMATCSFRIIIKVTRCSDVKRVNNGYRICHVSTDMRRGTRCRFGCYEGHVLQGVSTSTCSDSGRWTGWSVVQPFCKKKTCGQLLPILPLQQVTCSDSYNFRSICTFSCVNGYDILPNSTRVLVCKADSTWRGQQPQCIDKAPPIFNETTCPSVMNFYSSRGNTKSVVYWVDPTALDNVDDAIPTKQISGPSSSSVLISGVYTVVYEAEDRAGNRAKNCIMKVVVRHILCFQIYPTPYTSVSCPAGTGYGETCQFMCTGGAVLNGSSSVMCDKYGNPPYGRWTWSEHQPFCQFEEKCHELTPPVHGALACDNWFGGRYCHPLCQSGYDVPPRPSTNFPNLIVCGDSGDWSTPTDFTACQATTSSRTTKSEMYFYYEGECSTESAQQEIQEKFIEALLASSFKEYCLDTTECRFQNVMVICGTHDRKRRSDVSGPTWKRSTTGIKIGVEIEFTSTGYIDPLMFTEQSNKYVIMTRKLEDEIRNGVFSLHLQSGVELSAVDLKVNDLELKCDNNTVPSYPSMTCVVCSTGTYYQVVNGNQTCLPCRRGFYQNEESQIHCLKCPDGKSTMNEESINVDQCQDACPPGTWSDTSLPPCSKCPTGSYQPNYGAIKCIQCPAGCITQDEGSDTVDACTEFDIVFPKMETSDTKLFISFVKTDVTQTNMYHITLRMACLNPCRGDILILLDSAGSRLLSLAVTDNAISVSDGFSSDKSSFVPVHGQWYSYVLDVKTDSVSLYIDGSLVLNFPSSSRGIGPKTNISLGGDGFIGTVSQLNIFTNVKDISEVKQFSSKCSNSYEGDWLPWQYLHTLNLNISFIQIPSQCDDINECLSNPCINGSCTDDLGFYTCTCNAGYTGDICSTNINDCLAHSCQNGAECVDGVQSYSCKCKGNYTGEYCEIAKVDGGWTDWGNWSDCSLSCGDGTRVRIRSCSNPSPDNSGQECIGYNETIESCNTEPCPSCSTDILERKVDNGNFSCTKNLTIDLYVCILKCDEGYTFDHGTPDNYTCGQSTFYLWDFQTEDNPYGRLPQCVPLIPPIVINVTHSALYKDLLCTTDDAEKTEQLVLEMVSTVVNSLSCIQSNTCTKRSVDVSNCHDSRRKRDISTDNNMDVRNRQKRDTSSVGDTAGFNLELLCDSQTYGPEECYNILATAITDILGMESAGQLTTEINSADYLILANSSTNSDELLCPENTIEYYVYCVPCGRGRYYTNGSCELCPVGFYQDILQQDNCKICTYGWTTNGTGSISIDDCNVEMGVSISRTNNEDSNYQDASTKSVIGAIVGALTFATIVIIAILLLRHHLRHQTRTKKQGSLLSISMVRPCPVIAFPDVKEGWQYKDIFDTSRLEKEDKF